MVSRRSRIVIKKKHRIAHSLFDSLLRNLHCFRNTVFSIYRFLQLFYLVLLDYFDIRTLHQFCGPIWSPDDIFVTCSRIGNFQAMGDLQASWAPCQQPWNFGKVSSLQNPPSRMARASFAHSLLVVCALRVILAKIFMVTFRGSSRVGFARVGPLGPHSVNILLIFSFKWAPW